MESMKKTIISLFLALIVFGLSAPVFAQTIDGILPKGENCEIDPIKSSLQSRTAFTGLSADNRSKALGCAIKTGKVRLYMIPFYITYLIEFLLGLAGLISIGFVVYGGFRYVVGGLSEDKESGKKIIKHALIGLIVSLSAWILVNFIQVVVTSL